MRTLVVAGARPNFVKVAPILSALRAREREVEVHLVHTGQHYDQSLSGSFFDQLEIPQPDVNLEVGSGTHAQQTAEVMLRFEPVVDTWKPDLIIVVGDVNSTVACALVASKLGCAVAHVEAGLRSFDRTMPEEINRVLTDAISDFLFTTEPAAHANLLREGIGADKIFFTGNVMIDSLRRFLPAARQTTILEDLGLATSSGEVRPFGVLTLHRPSNVDSAEAFRTLVEPIKEIAREIPIVFPIHPRTRQRLETFGLGGYFRSGPQILEPGIWLQGPVGYVEFLRLLSSAAMVLTDSGGIQEETTALGVPCLTLRKNTERPVTVEEGSNQLVGTDGGRILAAARRVLAGEVTRGRIPQLWDGAAAERIVDILIAAHSRRGLLTAANATGTV